MSQENSEQEAVHECRCGCSHGLHPMPDQDRSFSRRGLLQGVGYAAVGAALGGLSMANAADAVPSPPKGVPLRLVFCSSVSCTAV
jgi:hypothetical protein